MKRSPDRVEQRRALAAHRLGHQQPVGVGAGRRERGGVELAELQVGELGPGRVRHHRAGADRPPGVGGPGPQRRRAAGGEDRRAGADRPGVGDDAVAALAVAPEGEGRGALRDLDPGLGGGERRQPLGDPLARAGAAGVDHPPPRVAALERERELAVGVAVELDAAVFELGDHAGRLGRRAPRPPRCGRPRARRRPCRPTCARGRVVRADRGGEPALGPEARALGERLARDHGDLGARLRRRSAPSSRPAAPAADHGDVGGALLVSGRGHASRRTVPALRWASTCATRARSAHDTGGHPENARRLIAIEEAHVRARLAGAGAGRGAGRRARAAAAGPRRRARRRDRGPLRRAAAA